MTRATLPSSIRASLSNAKLTAALSVAYLLSQAAIGSILHELDPPTVLRLQTTFSVEVFTSILEQWRSAGLIDTYWSHYRLDFPHPILYSALLAALLARAFDANGLGPRYDRLLLVPFIAGALDLVENLSHVIMLGDETRIAQPLVALSGLAANLKWLGALGSMVAVIVLFARARMRKAALT